MHQIGYWSKWKSHNRHFLISHLSLLRYIYLQFSFWTSHLRFMPKSCLRRPRGSEPTTRNFRGSLCWELRWIENLFVFKEDKINLTTCHQVDLRSIDHVYKNQFGKHLDKLVRRETQCCCLMLLLLSRSYCNCYCHCPGAGGDRRPLQKHIAGSSPPREDSLKKLWLGEEKTLQKSDDEAHTVCLWLWQVWHTVCHTANWKQGPDVCNSSFSTFCILTLKLLTCQIGLQF